ncbi:MAG: ribosome small subunit-dependent GTPase A [Planctomycetaceae bacterium]
MSRLADLGWTADHCVAFQPHAARGLVAARITQEHKDRFVVLSADAEWPARIAGRLRYEARGAGALPAVGDWVAVSAPQGGGAARIDALLPRRSALLRKRPDRAVEAQVLAANVDLVFLVESLQDEPKPRRRERFLAVAWESGGQPVIVLTKSDAREGGGEADAATVPVLRTSAVTGEGLDALRALLRPCRTGVFVGASGVGKSSLVNRLLEEAAQATGCVREEDGRGRHTTSHRQLFLLPGGGMLIDTPGLRELAPWLAEEGVEEAFADLGAVAARCRFRDCSHESEPGCAVKRAAASGDLDPDALESWRKLARENAHLARKESVQGRRAAKRRERRAARGHGRFEEGEPR